MPERHIPMPRDHFSSLIDARVLIGMQDRQAAGLVVQTTASLLRQLADTAERREERTVWPTLVVSATAVHGPGGPQLAVEAAMGTAPAGEVADAWRGEPEPGWVSDLREGHRREASMVQELGDAHAATAAARAHVEMLEQRQSAALVLIRTILGAGPGALTPAALNDVRMALTGEVE